MRELTSSQESLFANKGIALDQVIAFLDITMRLIECNRSEFAAWPDNTRTKFIISLRPEGASETCKKSFVVNGTYKEMTTLHDYFSMVNHVGFAFNGKLTKLGHQLYDEAAVIGILDYLKRISDEDYNYMDRVVTAKDVDVAASAFNININRLAEDGSIAGTSSYIPVLGNTLRWDKIYILPKGEKRVETGIYDLSVDPYPQPMSIQFNNASSKEAPAVTYVPTDSRVPESVRENVDEAKHCLSFGAVLACAVMARRAIQAICIEKGAKQHDLVKQIDELAANGIINSELKAQADAVRWVGNDAAHLTSHSVSREDAEDAMRLVDMLTHYLYIGPAIVQEQKTKRGK